MISIWMQESKFEISQEFFRIQETAGVSLSIISLWG